MLSAPQPFATRDPVDADIHAFDLSHEQIAFDDRGIPLIMKRSPENSCFGNLYFRTAKNERQLERCKTCEIKMQCTSVIKKVVESTEGLQKFFEAYMGDGGATRTAAPALRYEFKDRWEEATKVSGLDAALQKAVDHYEKVVRVRRYGYDKPKFDRKAYDRARYGARIGVPDPSPAAIAQFEEGLCREVREHEAEINELFAIGTGADAIVPARAGDVVAVYRAMRLVAFKFGEHNVTPRRVWLELPEDRRSHRTYYPAEQKRIDRLMRDARGYIGFAGTQSQTPSQPQLGDGSSTTVQSHKLETHYRPSAAPPSRNKT